MTTTQDMRAHVMCVGMGCLDNRLFVERFPPVSRRERVPQRRDALGGPASVGAVAVAQLGGKASVWGRRGDDSTGDQIEALLRAGGVDTCGFRVFPGCTSPRCEVFIRPDGERFLFPSWGEGIPMDAEWLPAEAIDSADALLIDGRWPEGGLRLAKQARERGIPIVLDFDLDTPRVWELARLATHVIADEDMTQTHGGVKGLLSRIERLGPWGAVTLGEKGVAFGSERMPAFPVQVVDSTGAGDVLHGAFALALAQGREEVGALRFASAAAAQRCALGVVPRLDQVVGLLNESK
jgi:sulfofructose kinase